jgi:hexosaminidase
VKKIIPYVLALATTMGCSRQYSIIPLPVKTQELEKGRMQLSDKTDMVYDETLVNSALFFQGYCNEKYHLSFEMVKMENTKKESNQIRLQLDNTYKEDRYQLEISDRGVEIRGSESGVFYGIQSLIQLLPVNTRPGQKKLPVPFIKISDEPRFAYRGMLLDVSRHFFPIDFLKKCIDLAAYHKMNYIHLHLTDDQGWRVEIKKYPNLNGIGSWRNGTIIGQYPGTGNDSIRYGGFYTVDEIKDLVEYAKKRYVTVVPEIEMPGHSVAALASYPYLGCTGGPYQVKETWGISEDVFCAGNDSVYAFLQNVLDEVLEMFPSKYIHIGGDECPKERWKKCPKCQARIRSGNMKDENELQSYFITRMEKYINSKGRTIIGWDEILEGGIAPNAVVMSWRGNGESGCLGAAKTKHSVILTPSYGFYLDYPQTSEEDSLAANWGGVTTVKAAYMFEPVNSKLVSDEVQYVIGAQANVWTEYMSNTAKVEYMMFPRLSAISEVLWSPKETRSWDDFKSSMVKQYQRYKVWGNVYNPAGMDME